MLVDVVMCRLSSIFGYVVWYDVIAMYGLAETEFPNPRYIVTGSLTDSIKDNIEMCFVIPVYLLLWHFLTSLQGNSIIVG